MSNTYFSRKIGNVDEGIVEGGVDVSDAENVLTFGDLWAEGDDLFNPLGFVLSWGHFGFLIRNLNKIKMKLFFTQIFVTRQK